MINDEFDICYSINIFLSNDYEKYSKKLQFGHLKSNRWFCQKCNFNSSRERKIENHKKFHFINDNIDIFKELIDNIKKFNKKYKIIIILNGCRDFDGNLKLNNLVSSYNNIIYKNNSSKRFWGHYSILGGYIESYKFMEYKKINYKYLILLTTNSYLINQINLENLDFNKEYIPLKKQNSHFIQMYERNKDIYNFFKKKNFHEYKIRISHEGVCYPKKNIDKIFNFIFENFHNKKDFRRRSDFNNSYDFIAEETLLPLCEYYFFKKIFPRIINVKCLQEKDFSITNINKDVKEMILITINQKDKFGIKPIVRMIDHPDRKFVRNLK